MNRMQLWAFFFKRKLGGFFVSWFKLELAYINPRVGCLLGKAVDALACVVCVYGGVLVDEVVEWNENVGRVTLQTVVDLYPEAWEKQLDEKAVFFYFKMILIIFRFWML